MKIAFDWGNTLVERGSGGHHRFRPMQQLWLALSKAGHSLIIVSHINPASYPSREEAVKVNNAAIAVFFATSGLPKPDRVITVTDDKLPVLKQEMPDLFIDDLSQWADAANASGITTLRLL